VNTLQQILLDTRDGDWGADVGEEAQRFRVVRGTDFESLSCGDAASVPTRFLTEASSGRRTLKLGDVLIETAGGSRGRPTGRTMLITKRVLDALQEQATCASFARFLRPDPDQVDSGYLYYRLQSAYRAGVMESFQVQHTGVARFQYTTFASTYQIDLPPLPTQRAIAEVLGALDDKIAANVRLQDSSRALRAASLGWALGRGSVSVPIGEATALLGRGKAPKYTETYGGVWAINQKCVRGGVVSVEQARLAEAMKEPQLQVGDTLVNSTGQGTLGRVGVWREDVGAFPDSHVTLVRFDPGKVDPWVGAEAVLAAESAIEALGEGSTGQTELSRKALTELQIELPAAGLHGGLGERLRQLHLREHQAANESRHLVTLRDTLLPHLMSGRLTVREAEKQVEAAL